MNKVNGKQIRVTLKIKKIIVQTPFFITTGKMTHN
jgi:hypothetical protein